MATQTLDLTAFRASFPAFSDVGKYPDAQVNMFFEVAGEYMTLQDSFCGGLSGATLNWALQLLTAHLLQIQTLIGQGQTSVIVQGATIDKVALTLMPPPVKTAFEWWLGTSPYGLQLLALLDIKSVGGWAIGGRPERAAFRKVGGRF